MYGVPGVGIPASNERASGPGNLEPCSVRGCAASSARWVLQSCSTSSRPSTATARSEVHLTGLISKVKRVHGALAARRENARHERGRGQCRRIVRTRAQMAIAAQPRDHVRGGRFIDRRGPRDHVVDELGQPAAGAAGDHQPEHGIAEGGDQQLRSALDHLLHVNAVQRHRHARARARSAQQKRAQPLVGCANRRPPGRPRRDASPPR